MVVQPAYLEQIATALVAFRVNHMDVMYQFTSDRFVMVCLCGAVRVLASTVSTIRQSVATE
jgi:hypothetical protein